MKVKKKILLKQKRRWRIRKKIAGSAGQPRLAVHFSNKHVYGQVIDDEVGRTLVYVSSLDKGLRKKSIKANRQGAVVIGRMVAEKSKKAGIDAVVFDRSGRLYHGCVKAFAEAAREGGLKF